MYLTNGVQIQEFCAFYKAPYTAPCEGINQVFTFYYVYKHDCILDEYLGRTQSDMDATLIRLSNESSLTCRTFRNVYRQKGCFKSKQIESYVKQNGRSIKKPYVDHCFKD